MSQLIIGSLIGFAIIAIYVFFRAGFRVENGNIGVLTVFGRFVRDRSGRVKTFGPGLQWRTPWAVAIQVALSERSLSFDDKGTAIVALGSDGTRIRVNARLRFRVDPAHVGTFLADSKDALEHLGGLFQLTVREQVARFEQRKEELSAFTALRLHMHDLQQRTLDAMKAAALSEYGIQVVAVDLLQIDPPEELVDALNTVITAESEANALVARTDLQAQQRVLSAEHAIAIANARALAVESEILTVGSELNALGDQGVLRDYVDRRRTEVLGGSKRVYLNHQFTERS